MDNISINQHNLEIKENLLNWQRKPVLRKIYGDFYKLIVEQINKNTAGKTVELGSGIGNLKLMLPDCICTDLFPNPWIDQVENAYQLSFADESVSNLVLFDVFHHLEFPRVALTEFHRVLISKGRVVIFEPCVSLLGLLVYGVFHHEPIGLNKKIKLEIPENFNASETNYYAAQGNASRIFKSKKYATIIENYNVLLVKKIVSISYFASGGYSKKQLFPDSFLPFMKWIDKICSLFPFLFATRLIVVLEKK
jgi:SAM-dependent methyltransferase